MTIKKSILAAITVSMLTPGVASAAFCAFKSGGFSPPTSVSCGSTTGFVSGDGPTDKVTALKTAGAAGKRVEVRGRDQNGAQLHTTPKCQAIASAINVPVSNSAGANACTDIAGPPARFFNGVLGRAES
jgi:hypothetical protein